MDLHQIQISPETAKAALAEYRDAVRAEAQREVAEYETRLERRRSEIAEQDAAILKGYEIIAKGKPVLNLRATLLAGGADAAGRPKLAIARADEREMKVTVYAGGRVVYRPPSDWQRGEMPARSATRVFDFLSLLPQNGRTRSSWIEATALVPHIPPHLRPSNLPGYHLLWEAEWHRLPPKDPALLKSLGAGLYAVMATWDLTPLEQAVLGAMSQ